MARERAARRCPHAAEAPSGRPDQPDHAEDTLEATSSVADRPAWPATSRPPRHRGSPHEDVQDPCSTCSLSSRSSVIKPRAVSGARLVDDRCVRALARSASPRIFAPGRRWPVHQSSSDSAMSHPHSKQSYRAQREPGPREVAATRCRLILGLLGTVVDQLDEGNPPFAGPGATSPTTMPRAIATITQNHSACAPSIRSSKAAHWTSSA